MYADRLEIECQVVAKDQQDISGVQLEASLHQLGSEDSSEATLVHQTTVGTKSDDHWVSVDTSAKANFKEAWYGGLIEVNCLQSIDAFSLPPSCQ